MIKKILYPFSFLIAALWDSIYKFRRFLFQYKLLSKDYYRVPIVSIGNVTFGGTGKTPMIIWLSGQLELMGLSPMILTRGYKGSWEKSGGCITPQNLNQFNAQECGDEPYLICSRLKSGAVVVGRKRSDNLKRYFEQIKPDAVLLDDGFQHLKLYRNFNIVLFDALLDLESYKTAPLGYLREGLSALRDADAIAISRANQVSSDKLKKLTDLISSHTTQNLPVSLFCYKATGLFSLSEKRLEQRKDQSVIAATGLASPESFYKSLEELGLNIKLKKVYSDHHEFTESDIEDLLDLAQKNNALVVMTEKDTVKVKQLTQDERINYLRVEVDFIKGEQELIDQLRLIL